MKALIVVKSVHHQNTARVARAMADVLQAEVRTPEEVTPQIVAACDLVGFGSGIYFGRFHPALRACVDRLTGSTARPRVFVFSTAGLPSWQRLWHAPLKRKLTRLGFEVLGEFSCRGYDTVGPLKLVGGLNRTHPDETDLAGAREFAHAMLERATIRPPVESRR